MYGFPDFRSYMRARLGIPADQSQNTTPHPMGGLGWNLPPDQTQMPRPMPMGPLHHGMGGGFGQPAGNTGIVPPGYGGPFGMHPMNTGIVPPYLQGHVMGGMMAPPPNNDPLNDQTQNPRPMPVGLLHNSWGSAPGAGGYGGGGSIGDPGLSEPIRGLRNKTGF